MRVIAGQAKGHNLKAPEGLNTRPTADKVKGSLFSMLTGYVYGGKALDLFAGSGALGIEALSRGADSCVFIDMGADAISSINSNLEHTKLKDKATVLKTDSLKYLETCKETFDIIFIDPPYNKGLAEKALEIIERRNLLAPDGIVSVERDESEGEIEGLFRLNCIKNKKYGRISLKIYKNGID